ncbi:MAG: prohibitin family protein [Armatimonadetes bacterium]|nr:prohibitin family protein [Armatimonadota bacterium]
MGLVWLGIILFIVSFVLKRFHTETGDKINLAPWAWTARIVAMLMIVAGLLSASIVIVPAGNRGVLLRFGAVQGVMSEGIHLILPYMNDVEQMEVRTQKEGSQATAASKDLQIVTTSLALNFHIEPTRVGDLFKSVGIDYRSRIIDPAVQESIKMVTARYTAEELIKNRAAVKAEVELDITKRLNAYDIVVEPAGLSITNFNFSGEFNAAIEAKQVAQQEAEKQKYILQKAELERQTEITKAKGASEAARLNAQALQAQGGSKVLAREWIEKWDGHVPTVSSSGGGVIIDINSLLKTAQ